MFCHCLHFVIRTKQTNLFMKMQAPTARQPVSIGRSKGSTAVNLFNVSLLGKNFLRAYLRWQLRFSHQERVWLRGLRRPQGRRGRSSRPQRERNVRSRVGFFNFSTLDDAVGSFCICASSRLRGVPPNNPPRFRVIKSLLKMKNIFYRLRVNCVSCNGYSSIGVEKCKYYFEEAIFVSCCL